MAIIRNTASMMLKGKIGDTTYYVSQSRQLARQALNNSNYGETASRTDVQQNRRVRWPNLVNFYSGNKAWMKKAYENLKPGVSVFNRFIQLNINASTVALTRGEAQAKIWVPAVYRISQGSLNSLTYRYASDMPGIELEGNLQITAETTVAQFSQALLAANPSFREGDAIVSVVFFGTQGAPDAGSSLKPASYVYRELVIDSTDAAVFFTKYPNWAMSEGMLICDTGDGSVAAVFIHTRKSSGKLYVSTQDMILNPEKNQNNDAWRSEHQFAKAIASYGESTTVPLNPGGSSTGGSGNDSSTGGDDDEGGTNLGE